MEQNELKKKIASGKLAGCYVFCGEEDYLKRHYVSQLRTSILSDRDLAAFNHMRYDGAKIDFSALAEAIKSPPFMADLKLIEWDNADFNRFGERDTDAFRELCELQKEYGWAAIVFTCPNENFDVGVLSRGRPSKTYSAISDVCDIVCFDKATDSQLISWLARRFAASSVSVTPDVCKAMLECSGHSMEILASEAEKLICFALARGAKEIRDEWVNAVCSHSFEGDAFGLTNAILAGDSKTAFAYLLDMKRRKVKPLVICDSVAKLYGELLNVSMLLSEGASKQDIARKMKMHEYKTGLYIKSVSRSSTAKIAENLKRISEFDVSAKSGGVAGYSALETLVASCL